MLSMTRSTRCQCPLAVSLLFHILTKRLDDTQCCSLTEARQSGAPKKMLYLPKCFAAASTPHKLGSLLLDFWPCGLFEIFLRQQPWHLFVKRICGVPGRSSHLLFCFQQTASSAIAVQPTENHHAAVGVFMMQLPGASDGFAPIGQTGICCATTLGTYGNRGPQSHSLHMPRGTIVKRSSMVTSCCT